MKVASAASAVPQSLLAFDVGTRRTGVASGNTLMASATPLETIEGDADAQLARAAALVAEWRPDALVVGVPFHPDGAAHVNTARAKRFARALGERCRLVVHEVDERYSTVEAQRAAGARRRSAEARIDAEAAAVILQQFLDGLA